MKPDAEQRKTSSRVVKGNSTWRRMTGKYRLFQLLDKDPRFRYTVVASLVVAGLLGIFLPRIWIVSPREYPVVYRVRLLDILFVRFERKSVEALSRGGDTGKALPRWEQLLAYNPCDVAALRGLLRDTARQPQPVRQWFEKSVDRAELLYSLAGTNIDDVAAVSRVYAAYGKHSKAIALLGKPGSVLSPFAASTLAIELIDGRQSGGFRDFWSRHGELLASNIEATVSQKAWEAGWGRGAVRDDAKAWLERASKDPQTSALALRLSLAVDENNADLPGFRGHYKQLQEIHHDRISDATAYWRLLELCGKRQAAVDLASAYNAPPQSASDGAVLVRAWRRLKLYPRINEFSRGRLLLLRDDTSVWSEVGTALAEAALWDDVRGLAASIRDYFDLKVKLGGYVNYLEGLAAHYQRERVHAAEYFDSAAGNLPADRELVFSMARGMRDTGYHQQADAVLSALAGEPTKLAPWLVGQLQTRWVDLDNDSALGFVDELDRADASSTDGQRATASTLVKTRQRPEDSLRIASSFATGKAPEPSDILVYAAALTQNAKLDEAKEQLKRTASGTLSASDRTFSSIIEIELRLAAGNPDAANELMPDLDGRFLTPAQRDWLLKQKHLIRTKVKGAS